MTQALISEGITVTREAIQAAAKLGGPGVDLLLAGVTEGSALDLARHDALHARLLFGEFDRAMELLEAGVRPSPECYSALGAKLTEGGEGWKERCQLMLNMMIPQTLIEHFTDRTLDVILNTGRPIHIERTLEILKRPPLFLFVPSMYYGANDAIETLRHLGMRMDDVSFLQVSADLASRSFVWRVNVQPLLDLYVQDNGQSMSARVVEPLLMATLRDHQHHLGRIRGPNDEGYKRASAVLLPYLNCMDPDEHLKLFDTIDRWAAAASVAEMVPVTVTAVLKHTIHAANRVAMTQLTEQRPRYDMCLSQFAEQSGVQP